jgi:hypothetical protein
MVLDALGLRTSPTYDPFQSGLRLRPEDLPDEAAEALRARQDFGDSIDSMEELQRFMKLLERLGIEQSRPSTPNGSLGMRTEDLLQGLIDWIQNGGNIDTGQRHASPMVRPPMRIQPSGGWGSGSSGGPAPEGSTGPRPTGDTRPLARHEIDTSKVDTSKIPDFANLSPNAQEAAKIAVAMGLTVTSTTGGTHTPSSNHYRHNSADGQGHAIDVAGPPELMAKFYNTMKSIDGAPRELFFDPLGGIENGQQIGAIGGHGDHVHYAA